ncbi:MAG: hypothetical protein JWL73_590 [Actinomycetia bacterium]|nr:hypothetical protein [Actinomycetes bacterium]
MPADELPEDLAATAAAMREQWREDEEDLGRDAAEAWGHGRTLVEELVGHMHRGDTLAFDVAGHTFTGPLAYVGSDYATVTTVGGSVDVRTMISIPFGPGARRRLGIPAPLVVRTVERARAGGLRPEPASPSLRARLYELEMDAESVAIGSMLLADEVRGRLRCAADHVTVTGDGIETTVPIAWIAYLRRVSD